jgi:hypothetical protein
MRAKESRTGNVMRLSVQFLELVNVFKEASRNFIFIFLFNETRKNKNKYLQLYKRADLIL